MIVRTVEETLGTEREVKFGEGISYRPVLEKDGVGFSVHKTVMPKGVKGFWHYKNHYEVCYCIVGSAVLTNLLTLEQFTITPDTVYILNEHEPHTFETLEDTVLISVFNPPVKGQEVHDANGSYSI